MRPRRRWPARAQAEASRRAALAAVSSAYLTAQSGHSQIDAARVARDVAQITYDKTVRGYQNGLFPLLNVLNAQSALTQARIAYTQAVYSAAIAVSALGSSVSGGAATGTSAPTLVPSGPPGPNPPGNGGTSPAGAGGPNTTPAGTSTTGNNPGGAGAGGRGTP